MLTNRTSPSGEKLAPANSEQPLDSQNRVIRSERSCREVAVAVPWAQPSVGLHGLPVCDPAGVTDAIPRAQSVKEPAKLRTSRRSTWSFPSLAALWSRARKGW
jgi:hypothetical protein